MMPAILHGFNKQDSLSSTTAESEKQDPNDFSGTQCGLCVGTRMVYKWHLHE